MKLNHRRKNSLKTHSFFLLLTFFTTQLSWGQEIPLSTPTDIQPAKSIEDVSESAAPVDQTTGQIPDTIAFLQDHLPLDKVENSDLQNYEYERYEFDEALENLRPEYASAVIVKGLTAENLKKLVDQSFETGILVLHVEIVLFTSGSEDEIGVLPAARELISKASFISHTHPSQYSKEGPSGQDLNEAVAAPNQEYVLTQKGVYVYNQEGILNDGNSYTYDWYLTKLQGALSFQDSRERGNDSQVEARKELNLFIAEQDRYNNASEKEKEIFRRGGTLSYTSGLSSSSATTLPGDPLPYLVPGSSAGTKLSDYTTTRLKLEYSVPNASDFSGLRASFDNETTPAVETQDLSVYTSLTFGLRGPNTAIELKITDINGVEDSFTLTNISSSTERFWRIPVSSISNTLDKTKIKSIQFIVSQSHTTDTTRIGTLYIRVKGLDTDSPERPVITSSVPQATQQSTLVLTGTKEAHTAILINDIEVVPADSSTTWQTIVNLPAEGNNKFYLRTKNAIGKTSYSTSITVRKDTIAPTGSIRINSDATFTSSVNVSLRLSASDSGSGIDKMSFSDDGIQWKTPENFTSTKTYTLPPGDGNKTVYVKYYDKAGNERIYSKSIILDTLAPTGSININGGATHTNSPVLTLNLSAVDNGSGIDKMRFSNDNVNWTSSEPYVATKQWTVASGNGTRTVYVRYYDKIGRVSPVYSKSIILDTIPPQMKEIFIEEGAIVDIPYLAISFNVEDAGSVSEQYQTVDLQVGLNTIDLIGKDTAGNEVHATRHIYYTPTDILEDEWQALRNRLIQENLVYFQEGQGINSDTGFPIDVIGTMAPPGVTWSQPTSIGFYLQFLGEIITKRLQVNFLTPSQALAQAQKVLSNLLQIQNQWGWKGLIPWIEMTPVLKPSNEFIGFIDNANLSHSLAALEGALMRANLDRTLAEDLVESIGAFLANHSWGYQSFVDPVSGVFRATYNTQTQALDGFVDRFGSEIRANIPFLITFYNLPASLWNNLIRSNSRYLTQEGRIVHTFSTYDGAGFQSFWPLLNAPEEDLPSIRAALQNALLIHHDFMEKNDLAGFVSAATLPEGGYSGKIGIDALKETPAPLDSTVGSVYSLAAAYRLNPEFILAQLKKIEETFPALKGPLGFYDSARSNNEISHNYYAIDQGSFILGLLGRGADDFKFWMQKKNLWDSYEGFYSALDLGISQAVQELPEPPVPEEEIYNGRIDSGNLYATGQYHFNEFTNNGISVAEQPNGTFLYTPADNQGWIGGTLNPLMDLNQHALVTLMIRNAAPGNQQLDFEVKQGSAYFLNQTISFTDNDWHSFQFLLPKAGVANFIGFARATGAFEVREVRFSNIPASLWTYPPVESSVLDNFDTLNQVQTYWDSDGALVYQRTLVEGSAFEGAHALLVNFAKTPALPFSFFALQPNQNGSANDFSPFRSLRLRLNKLHQAPMTLLVKFEFNGTDASYETQITFAQGASGWQEAVFDFSAVPLTQLVSVENILFFVDPGSSTTQGSFLIDNILLDA